MAKPHILVSLAGFDSDTYRALEARARRRITLNALVTFVPCLQLGASTGYGVWLLEASGPTAIALGLLIGFFVLNLLRLANASGGLLLPTEYHGHRHRSWAPPTLLAILSATAALLPLRQIPMLWDDPIVRAACLVGFVVVSLLPHVLAQRTTHAYETEQRRQGLLLVDRHEEATQIAVTALLSPYREVRP